MQTGDVVVHPQWGRGTVLFDKPHCIGVRFIEHGQVNFSQEEWLAQKSPPERFRGVASMGGSVISDLEYTLQEAVENMELSEVEACRMLDQNVHPLEIRRLRRPSLLSAYQRFQDRPSDKASEDDFYAALLAYITGRVKRASPDSFTFTNIEDSIQESVLEVWQRLSEFDSSRSDLQAWVGLITLHNIRDALRRQRTNKGQSQRPVPQAHRQVELEEEFTPSRGLPIDVQFDVRDFMGKLTPLDRSILQMTSEGLTLREVGAEVGLSEGSVRKRLKKMRLRYAK